MLMNGYLVEKLGIAPASPSPQEVQETRKALREGADMLRGEGNPRPSLKALIWRLLQDAAETLTRIPDRERAWLQSASRSAWPAIAHTAQEQFAAEVQRSTDARMSKDEGPLPRMVITDPSATRRMLTVLGWLRHVRAQSPYKCKRDKIAIMFLAGGLSTTKVRIACFPRDSSDSAVAMVKQKVIAQIETAVNSMKIIY